MRRFAAGFAALLPAVAGCHDTSEPMAPDLDPGGPALSRVPDQVPPNRYLVVFRPGVQNVQATARTLASAQGAALGFVYEHAIRGFSVELPADCTPSPSRRCPPACSAYSPTETTTSISTEVTTSGWTWT